MPEVFRRVELFPRTLGGNLLTWSLNPLFEVKPPVLFNIMVSRAGTDDFTLLETVTDDFEFYLDTSRYLFAIDPTVFYRVDLVDGDSQRHESRVIQPVGSLSRNDYLKYKEMVRRESKRLSLYAGTCGYLWKRRQWGVKCTVCLDWDTGEATRSNCPSCFGTRFESGYYKAVPMLIELSNNNPRAINTDENIGQTEPQTVKGRCLACPWLDTGDVWGRSDTDQRYIIRSVTELKFRGLPMVIDPLELRLAPATDPVYGLLTPDEVYELSSSSSSSGGNP